MNHRQLKKNLHLLPYSKKTRNVVTKPPKITSNWSEPFDDMINLFELSKRGPYYRFLEFPVEINERNFNYESPRFEEKS